MSHNSISIAALAVAGALSAGQARASGPEAAAGTPVASRPTYHGLKLWDADGDGEISAAECKAMTGHYRQLAERPRKEWELLRYDKNRNGRLDKDEISARAADIKKQQERAAEYRRTYQEAVRKHDTDGDGKLNREQSLAVSKLVAVETRRKYVEQWDANGDGKVDSGEQRFVTEQYYKQGEYRQVQQMLKRHDLDGDGVLNAREQAAFDAEHAEYRKSRQEQRKRGEAYIKRWDTDGDGVIGEDDRKAMAAFYRAEAEKRRRAWIAKWDTDGDGKLSDQERKAVADHYRAAEERRRRELMEKWDTDRSGVLSAEERKVMYRAWNKQRQGRDLE